MFSHEARPAFACTGDVMTGICILAVTRILAPLAIRTHGTCCNIKTYVNIIFSCIINLSDITTKVTSMFSGSHPLSSEPKDLSHFRSTILAKSMVHIIYSSAIFHRGANFDENHASKSIMLM